MSKYVKDKFSVLLTTYNRPEMLEQAVLSVLRQTHTNFEIIVLDDNSSDKDQLELLERLEDHPKIKVIRSDVKPEDRTKTTRYATMINMGFPHADGEYVSYLCDDDRFMAIKFEKAFKKLKEPGVQAVYGIQALKQINSDGTETDYEHPIRKAELTFSSTNSASCNVDHSSVIHRRELVDKAGLWNDDSEHWGTGDGEYWNKLHAIGVAFHPIPEILDIHVYHNGSVTKEANWKKLGTEEENVKPIK